MRITRTWLRFPTETGHSLNLRRSWLYRRAFRRAATRACGTYCTWLQSACVKKLRLGRPVDRSLVCVCPHAAQYKAEASASWITSISCEPQCDSDHLGWITGLRDFTGKTLQVAQWFRATLPSRKAILQCYGNCAQSIGLIIVCRIAIYRALKNGNWWRKR